jgi:hypothetical protein
MSAPSLHDQIAAAAVYEKLHAPALFEAWVGLPEEEIEQILVAAEGALADFVSPEGQVVFDSPAHIVIGDKA